MDTFFDALYVILVSTALGAAIILASRALYLYVRSQVTPGQEIVLGAFTTLGEGLPSDSKEVGNAVASKIERLKRLTSRAEGGFGLVRSPVLASIPDLFKERQSHARKQLENLNVKVKDVEVKSLLGIVRSAFEPARPTLQGQVTAIGDRIEVRAEMLWKEAVIAGWIADGPKLDKMAETLNHVYDDLLFQVVYDIPRNPKLHWLRRTDDVDDFQNWQTLQAVTLGLDALQTYARSLEHADLLRAIKHLERVELHAPDYALGHYFLAVALGEGRFEARAAAILARVERMNPGPLLAWNARFQRSAAMLRLYSPKTTEEAVAEIADKLIPDLIAAADNADKRRTADETSFASRLLPMAYAQLAYAYGTLFTMESPWPRPDLRARSIEASRQALERFNKVKDTWPADREREKREVERAIYNARGYSAFRIAQFERAEAQKAKQPAADVEKAFRAACDKALEDLHKANDILPNNYLVLQNQAMILDDPDYDPGGLLLTQAEMLYDRTKQMVPRDYYQYERLSRIYWRQMRSQPHASVQRELATKGIEAVSQATKNRHPEKSVRNALFDVYFRAVDARLEADAATKRKKLTEAVDLVGFATSLKPPETTKEAEDAADALTAAAETVDVSEKAGEEVKKNATKARDDLRSWMPGKVVIPAKPTGAPSGVSP